MNFLRRNFKRFATDAGGYILILAGIAFGWLPGPGGIPLIIAGLGLLAINNPWAARIRDHLLKRGGSFVKALFPTSPLIQWLYDVLALALLALSSVLAYQHAELWQISLSVASFFLALFIGSMNRDRLRRLKRKH
jgi:hypothetical protein